jgi:uncharacterized protein with PIN domain
MVTREEFLNNQHEFCKQNKAPFFMPSNGRCWKCKEDIIKILIERGEDGTSLVTGCPKCNRSYCD